MSDIDTTADTTTPTEPEIPATSLAEHREQFPAKRGRNTPLPTADPPAAAATPAPKAAHRAKSHKAGPDDVDEIARLTKELRETEKAIVIDRKPGESDRVFELRRRAEIAKRATSPSAAPPAPAPAARPAPVAAQPAAVPVANLPPFTEPEPQFASFADQTDPYAAHTRALAAWDRRKERFEDQQQQHVQQQRVQIETFDREMIGGMAAHAGRVIAYEQANPDVSALFKAESAKPEHEQIQLTLAMRGAIEFHERGPEMVVALLKHPDLADELFLLTEGRAVGDPRTDPTVATVRRRLLQRVAAVTTGAAPSTRTSLVAPHPPTPVRTAPQTPREKSTPSAGGSLREHMESFPLPRRH